MLISFGRKRHNRAGNSTRESFRQDDWDILDTKKDFVDTIGRRHLGLHGYHYYVLGQIGYYYSFI